MISRRRFTAGMGAAVVAPAFAARPGRAGGFADLARVFARIEAQSRGRLGVAVLDTGSGAQAGHRADQRFAMCSTFKLLASAAVLARVDAGAEQLDRRVRYTAEDLVTYSPTTERHVATGMTLAELCEAAITLSDNTAGNLLLAAIGGPAGFTAYARALGDGVTRLDRTEPALNEAVPGDPRDTTAPAAMLGNLRSLVLGTALSAGSRERLVCWMVGNRTGDARLRAGLPGWRVGDKTGSGRRGSTNDIGVAWPPQGAPVVITAYLTQTAIPAEQRNAALAAVGRAVAAALG
jgi:beta-lactamase class A